MGRHKEWRKIAKKMMRKRRRTQLAKERDARLQAEEEKRAQSPSYKLWLEEQEKLEIFRQEEEKRLHDEQNARWLQEEEKAQEYWLKQQKRLERLRVARAKQELIIKEEWEKEQQKLKEEAEARELEKQRKEREQAQLMERIEQYIEGTSDRLPSSARTITETQPGCEPCPFFSKVAACRFRDVCSRNHIRPSVSRTLLIPGFYSNFRIEHVNQSNEYDTDVGLEFDDKEIYDDFLDFYHDVLREMKTYGTVVQFKVCCNVEPHLRGNVYVQYSEERHAMKAFRALQGRFYGGKRLSVEFCNVKSWKSAICGLDARTRCPKGGKCNFLHVFRNPGYEFRNADRDAFRSPPPSSSSRENMDWNWSPSSESSTRRGGKRERRTPRERENWNWSPEYEPVVRRKRKSSPVSNENENDFDRHSSRPKERNRSNRSKSEYEKSDRRHSTRSSSRRSKENRTSSRRSRASSGEETS